LVVSVEEFVPIVSREFIDVEDIDDLNIGEGGPWNRGTFRAVDDDAGHLADALESLFRGLAIWGNGVAHG
jgi:hypothetical protein